MSDKNEILPVEQGGDELLIRNADSRAWEIFTAVRELHRQGYNTSDACQKLGIDRRTYYHALHRPFVQEQRVQEIMALKEASAALIAQRWTGIMANMTNLARNGDSKEAVQAARFVREVYKDLEKDAEELVQAEQQSALAQFAERLKMAPGKKTVRARQSRRRGDKREEIEVEVEFPGGN